MPHLLIADDSPINRALLQQLATLLGCRRNAVNNGAQALAYLQAERVDALLLDYAMPDMDGVTVTRLLREREAREGLPALPILAITAFTSSSVREQFTTAGVSGFLYKPVTLAALQTELRKILAWPQAEVPLLDEQATAKMRQELGARYTDFMARFQQYALQQCASLQQFIAAQQWPLARQKAHQFKGECLQIGARRLAAACLALEHALERDPPTDTATPCAAVAQETEALQRAPLDANSQSASPGSIQIL